MREPVLDLLQSRIPKEEEEVLLMIASMFFFLFINVILNLSHYAGNLI